MDASAVLEYFAPLQDVAEGAERRQDLRLAEPGHDRGRSGQAGSAEEGLNNPG